MKFYTLPENYEITRIENGGDRVQIAFNKEGISENDYVFLTKHPNLQNFKYEVIKKNYANGLYYADLVRIQEELVEENNELL